MDFSNALKWGKEGIKYFVPKIQRWSGDRTLKRFSELRTSKPKVNLWTHWPVLWCQLLCMVDSTLDFKNTHIYILIHTLAHTYIHGHAHTHIHIYTQAHTHTNIHTCTHMGMQTYTCTPHMHTHGHAYTWAHTCTHTHTRKPSQAHRETFRENLQVHPKKAISGLRIQLSPGFNLYHHKV